MKCKTCREHASRIRLCKTCNKPTCYSCLVEGKCNDCYTTQTARVIQRKPEDYFEDLVIKIKEVRYGYS